MSEPRGRPFAVGNSLGRGRPKGSRNKPNSPGQDLLDTWAEALTRKCISMAGQGNVVALRLCMERISPARRDDSIRISLPKIRKPQDIDKAADKVTQAVARGKITPASGEKVMNILDIRSGFFEPVDAELRLAKLEDEIVADAPPLAA